MVCIAITSLSTSGDRTSKLLPTVCNDPGHQPGDIKVKSISLNRGADRKEEI
jgi:hypothetical protein